MSTGIQFNDSSISFPGGYTIHSLNTFHCLIKTLKITDCPDEDPSCKLYKFNKQVNIRYTHVDGFLKILVDNCDFMIIETEELALTDSVNTGFAYTYANTELSNIEHLLSPVDYDELNNLWDT